jgi:CRISPR-associated Cas5-like protein
MNPDHRRPACIQAILKRRRFFRTLLLAGAACLTPIQAQIVPASSTTQWVPVLYSNSFPDPPNDLQTGSQEADLIGNSTHPAFYLKYDDGGLPGSTNGWLGFRLRLGADTGPNGFKGTAFVGIDADRNGSLDLFIGVNNQGGGNHIGIWNPGPGLNTSPNTTTIVSPANQTYSETASTYSFTSISLTIDPTATSFDLDAMGNTDQFLSFVIPFSDLVQQISLRGIAGFNRDTPVNLVAATATQDNSLNQDLNGVLGGINSGSTWAQLGAFTKPYSLKGSEYVPEPSPSALIALAAAFGIFFCLRRRLQ